MSNITREQIDNLYTEFSKNRCIEHSYRYGDINSTKVINKSVEDYLKECTDNGYIIADVSVDSFDYCIEGSENKWSYYVTASINDVIDDDVIDVFVDFINFLKQKQV